MSNAKKEEINLWELTPRRNAEWETGEDGNVVVLVPKFKNVFLVRWVLPHLAKPFFRIKLDEVGSAIWRECDGQKTVGAISELLTTAFGERVEPVSDRMGKFLKHLERGDLLIVENRR